MQRRQSRLSQTTAALKTDRCSLFHLHTPESTGFYLVCSLIRILRTRDNLLVPKTSLPRTFDSPRRAVRGIECLRYTRASTTPPLSTITLQYVQLQKKNKGEYNYSRSGISSDLLVTHRQRCGCYTSRYRSRSSNHPPNTDVSSARVSSRSSPCGPYIPAAPSFPNSRVCTSGRCTPARRPPARGWTIRIGTGRRRRMRRGCMLGTVVGEVGRKGMWTYRRRRSPRLFFFI